MITLLYTDALKSTFQEDSFFTWVNENKPAGNLYLLNDIGEHPTTIYSKELATRLEKDGEYYTVVYPRISFVSTYFTKTKNNKNTALVDITNFRNSSYLYNFPCEIDSFDSATNRVKELIKMLAVERHHRHYQELIASVTTDFTYGDFTTDNIAELIFDTENKEYFLHLRERKDLLPAQKVKVWKKIADRLTLWYMDNSTYILDEDYEIIDPTYLLDEEKALDFSPFQAKGIWQLIFNFRFYVSGLEKAF